jgi:uncharacterized delta-60 repeat protein
MLLRYHSDGTLDGGFGSGGKVVWENSSWDFRGIVARENGQIIVAGQALVGGVVGARLFAFNPDGSCDLDYGDLGSAIVGFEECDSGLTCLRLQEDGKIVAGGFTFVNGHEDSLLVRCDTSGMLDATFGTGGRIVTSVFGDYGECWVGVGVQADGRIVAAGSSMGRISLARYCDDGSADSSFGTDGVVSTATEGRPLWSRCMALQEDGKIVVGGDAESSYQTCEVLVARYDAGEMVLPEIAVEQPEGADLTDGFSAVDFGAVDPGGSTSLVFTVRNVGSTNLTSLFVILDGADAGEFQVGALGATTLVAGDSTTFTVAFSSSVPRPKTAAIHIYSNDRNENPFDIILTGTCNGEYPGKPDAVARTPFGDFNDWGRAVATQADGKIVVAGQAGTGFGVARYGADAVLDDTFGVSGIVSTAIGEYGSAGCAVAVQADGKIVVAGWANNGMDQDFALVRYNPEGTLDAGFGSDGIVTTAVGSGDDVAYAVAVQADGKIVVAGCAFNGSDGDFALARYHSDGALDSTFGAGGIVTTAVGSGDDCAYGLALQSDGAIVVAGFASDGGTSVFALARYGGGGSLDTGFGSGGTVTVSLGGIDDQARGVAVQADGKIVAAGYAQNTNYYDDVALVRCNADGTLDSAFGASGKVVDSMDECDDGGCGVAIQADGRILVAGTAASTRFAVLRCNTDGTRDTGFGVGGVASAEVGGMAFAGGIALTPNGKAAVAGTAFNPDAAFALVLFDAGPSVPTATPLQRWRQAHFGSPDNSGDGADGNDFEGDGMPNLTEYAFGGDPKGLDDADTRLRIVCEADRARLYFPCNAACSDITYLLQSSPSLDSPAWVAMAQSAGGGPVTPAGVSCSVSDSRTGRRTVTVTDAVPTTAAGKRFYRIVVTCP